MTLKSLALAAAATVLVVGAAQARDQIRIVGSSTVFPFTTAVAELSSQNWASGTARFAGASVVLLKLTFGTIAATQLVQAMGWQPQLVSGMQLPPWAEWAGLLVGSGAFAVLFGAARRDGG
jgi:hypothetical protein